MITCQVFTFFKRIYVQQFQRITLALATYKCYLLAKNLAYKGKKFIYIFK